MKNTQCFVNEVALQFQKKLFCRNTITSAGDAAEISREIYHATESQIELKEYFFIIMLNRANEVIGYSKIGEGGISSTQVDLRLAFATAIKCLASGIILLHNHPSAQIKPSPADIELTKKFSKLAEVLEIAVLDHIILTANSYCSFLTDGISMK
jgi:DNA repair protein RadC